MNYHRIVEWIYQIRNRADYFLKKEWYYYRKRLTKKYYVIYRSAGGAGFFSNYMWVLGHVIFAKKLGYVPVVDMEHYPTLYSENEPIQGESNAWNYYFENVGEVSLEEVYAGDRYVLGEDAPLHLYEGKYCVGNYRYPTDKAISYYAPIIQENLRLKVELKEELEERWRECVEGTDQILGIHVRGTDMKNNLGHPMPAAVQNYLDKAREILEEHPKITKIFLATDECNVIENFTEAFRDDKYHLFMNEAFRVWDTGEICKKGVHETQVEHARPNHKYLLGKEVLQDAYFLSRSDYLLCGHSNISNVALLWNNHQFKDVVCIGQE